MQVWPDIHLYLYISGFPMYTKNDNIAGVGGFEFGGIEFDENSRSAGYLVSWMVPIYRPGRGAHYVRPGI